MFFKLEPSMEQYLIDYLKGVTSRTLDEYRKLEGMETTDVSKTLSELKKEE
ncbi:MAG: hypothetical protein ACTSXH_15500 [Promethearchaeota archaeon]